jgi:hypothetical protein
MLIVVGIVILKNTDKIKHIPMAPADFDMTASAKLVLISVCNTKKCTLKN